MDYKVYMPQPDLKRYIRYYWSLESGTEDPPHERERIFPDGCIELIFNYRDLFRQYFKDQTTHLQERGIIYGQIKSYIEVEATGKVGLFSVRFNPAGLQPFINFDVDTFTSRTLLLNELWGNEGIVLQSEMIACATNEERVAMIEDFLLKKQNDSKKDNNAVEYCVAALTTSQGSMAINAMAEEMNISKRQLERIFSASVGLSPKMLARIIRFQNTLQLMDKKEFTGFTGVAYDGGFYDQAHFIKDFKDFTGLNPKQYFSENLEMVKHFSFDE